MGERVSLPYLWYPRDNSVPLFTVLSSYSQQDYMNKWAISRLNYHSDLGVKEEMVELFIVLSLGITFIRLDTWNDHIETHI